MSGPDDARGPRAVAKFLRPRSVAIIGISTRAGSAGQVILQSLKVNKFQGDIHLVGRSTEPIDGRPVLKSPQELPEGVDLAVFTLPAAGVREAVEACARRKVGSAMVFAAGFAETGEQQLQDEVAKTARDGGLAIVGPNCLGYTNNVDGLMLHMLLAREALRFGDGSKPGLAFVGQSGGLLGHFQRAADGRGLPLSYVISTGNEIGLELTDFVEYLAADPATGVLVLYAEQVRRPREFLDAIRRARAAGKPVILMFPGRSAKSRQAARSHTGALVGDYATMRVLVEDAGAIVVTTMDEMMDLAEILVHYPKPPEKGPAILTASGAFVALCNDIARRPGPRFPGPRAGDRKASARGVAGLRQLRQSARRHGRFCPGLPVGGGGGAARRSQCRNVAHLLSDQYRRRRAEFQQGNGRIEQAQGPGGARRHAAARRRCHGRCEAEPGGVRALVRSNASRRRALYALRAIARASSVPLPRPRRSRGCPGSARAHSPSGSARKCWLPPASMCRTAASPARPAKRPQWPGASAIPWS